MLLDLTSGPNGPERAVSWMYSLLIRTARNGRRVEHLASATFRAVRQQAQGPVGYAALSGVVFVVLFAIAATLYAGGAGSSQADITAYYSDASAYSHQIEGFALLTAACLALLLFVVVSARSFVAHPLWSDVSIVSGAIACAFLLMANALWAATAFTVTIQRTYAVSASVHLIVEDAAFVCLVTSMAAALPWVLITSFGRRAPKLLIPVGVISSIGQVLAYWYLPLGAFLLWVAVGSVLLTARPIASRGRPEPGLIP